MRRPLPALAALALTLAGCIATPQAGPPDGGEPVAPADVEVAGDRPEPTFGDVATGPAAQPDLEASLMAAPRLIPGEWWRIRFYSPLDGTEEEFVRVVAAVQDGEYVVGMPHEGWYKEAVVYHAPGFGDVQADLSYFTHDEHFVPVTFPLTPEQTWTTTFSGGPEMAAEVTLQDEHVAQVTFTDADGATVLELVYDATIHEVREFRHSTIEYRVVEHGYGFEGWITVPRGEDLVFLHGRFAGVLGFGGTASGPTETVEVSGGFNRVTFIQVVGSLNGPAGTPSLPGVYRTVARAPDGTEFVTEALPSLGGLTIQFFEFPDPDGTWELEHVAGGLGVAFAEGIAYHQYDIRLPDGARRADHSHKVIR